MAQRVMQARRRRVWLAGRATCGSFASQGGLHASRCVHTESIRPQPPRLQRYGFQGTLAGYTSSCRERPTCVTVLGVARHGAVSATAETRHTSYFAHSTKFGIKTCCMIHPTSGAQLRLVAAWRWFMLQQRRTAFGTAGIVADVCPTTVD